MPENGGCALAHPGLALPLRILRFSTNGLVNKEVNEMRELSTYELSLVSGGNEHQCTPGNSYGGISDARNFGQDLIDIYEGLIQATSHIIERVANSF